MGVQLGLFNKYITHLHEQTVRAVDFYCNLTYFLKLILNQVYLNSFPQQTHKSFFVKYSLFFYYATHMIAHKNYIWF